jgi:hypothetical protein
MTRATIRRAMSSVVGQNGRSNTRERSGISVGPMRLAWSVVVFKISRGYSAGVSLKLVSEFCSACISASDSRKASVDSAP